MRRCPSDHLGLDSHDESPLTELFLFLALSPAVPAEGIDAVQDEEGEEGSCDAGPYADSVGHREVNIEGVKPNVFFIVGFLNSRVFGPGIQQRHDVCQGVVSYFVRPIHAVD